MRQGRGVAVDRLQQRATAFLAHGRQLGPLLHGQDGVPPVRWISYDTRLATGTQPPGKLSGRRNQRGQQGSVNVDGGEVQTPLGSDLMEDGSEGGQVLG